MLSQWPALLELEVVSAMPQLLSSVSRSLSTSLVTDRTSVSQTIADGPGSDRTTPTRVGVPVAACANGSATYTAAPQRRCCHSST